MTNRDFIVAIGVLVAMFLGTAGVVFGLMGCDAGSHDVMGSTVRELHAQEAAPRWVYAGVVLAGGDYATVYRAVGSDSIKVCVAGCERVMRLPAGHELVDPFSMVAGFDSRTR